MANQHVVPHGDVWQVKSAGSQKATKTFETQMEAITFGRDIARRQEVELLIHGRNGQIRERDSYGNDPCPPVDKK